MKIFLQHKILLIYIILVAVIGSMVAILIYERQQMQKVEDGVERLWQMHEGIHNAHRHITELALLGEAAAGWNNKECDIYHSQRTQTDSVLASLKIRSRLYIPIEKIDTLRKLLEEKERMLINIMETQRKQKIANTKIMSEFPSAVRQATLIKQVTVKKKGIAGWFGGKKTIQMPPQTDKLNKLGKRMAVTHQRNDENLDEQTDSLMIKNELLGKQLVCLVNQLDNVTETAFLQHGRELDMIRIRSFHLLASVLGMATILLVLSFIIIRQDIRRNEKDKIEKGKLIVKLQTTSHKNEELIKARRNIMQTVAHGLRTPLTAICGNAELIKSSHEQVDWHAVPRP